jgi:hypothetical protein
MLGQAQSNLEEIEREDYKGCAIWNITLSFPRVLDQISPIARLGADPLQYKRFLIDGETGDLIAIKLRELAAR